MGAGLSQSIFYGDALMVHHRATLELYDAMVLQYKSAVLSVFENVVDTLAALENDAWTLTSAEVVSTAARTVFNETALRRRLGALPASAEQSSELQYLNARPDTVRATSRRTSDTAASLQAMGGLPANTVQTTAKD